MCAVPPVSSPNLPLSDKPLVSVIIIFLNAERFLEEAIESVLSQTFANWELLLVDDGSTDGSTEIARSYSENESGKVGYLEHDRHENRGMSASRNLGIRYSKGKHIAFLDSDDVWLPHKLERQVAILNAHPEAGMVYGGSQYWYSWMGSAEIAERDYVLKLGIQPNSLVKPPTLLTLLLESKAPTPCPSDILLSRETVQNVGGFEESFLGPYQLFEDQAFLSKVYLQTPVFVSGECWDRYRQHPDSCVSVANATGQKYNAGIFFIRWLEGYLSAKGITDIGVWQALRKKCWRYRHPKLYSLLAQVRGWTTQPKEGLKSLARQTLPAYLQVWLQSLWRRDPNDHPVNRR